MSILPRIREWAQKAMFWLEIQCVKDMYLLYCFVHKISIYFLISNRVLGLILNFVQIKQMLS